MAKCGGGKGKGKGRGKKIGCRFISAPYFFASGAAG